MDFTCVATGSDRRLLGLEQLLTKAGGLLQSPLRIDIMTPLYPNNKCYLYGDAYVTSIDNMDVVIASNGGYWALYHEDWVSALSPFSGDPVDRRYKFRVTQEIIDFCKAHRALSS